MFSTRWHSYLLLSVLFVCCSLAAFGAQNMIGRQSQNEGMQVLPAPGKVTIDGNLKDWDWTGRIWSFADSNVRSRYSVEAAAMWDKENLYLAAKWKDPTPMFNTVDPDFNPQEGWKSDSWQIRLLTDQTSHLTTWFFTEKRTPVMHISTAQGGGGKGIVLCQEGRTELGQGVAMAYRRDDDGKGYVQEIRIPWTLLYKTVPEIKPGLIFRQGNEFLWGDPTGKTWPIHRYADNMQPGATSREFYWKATQIWGNAELVAKGKVPVRQYIDEESQLQGSIPVLVTLPASAARFTIAINDAQGNRVRNLAGDFLPEDYEVSFKGNIRTVIVKWDGLDDNGKLVAPGTYQAVGLTHEGIGAEYDMCFYNPGTPPWETVAGNGAWGADHNAPNLVATSGDWMIVSWPGAEGGSGILAVGPDGLKKWGEKRGATTLAADEQYVYAITSSWQSSGVLCRFDKKTGAYRPFMLNGKARPFELSMEDIFGKDAPRGADGMTVDQLITALNQGQSTEAAGLVTGMASHGGKFVLALRSGKLAVLDAATATVQKLIDVPQPTAVAFSTTGACYAFLDGKLHAVDLTSGKLTLIATPGLEKPVGLAVDLEGNIVVADRGADCQVKAYTPDGKLAYTAGKKGGRPTRGAFDEQAMLQMTSVAVDYNGHIWVVESWDNPRRVSVWGRDGKLVRDYIGNTAYSSNGVYLDERDPSVAYCGSVGMKLDRATRSWKVSEILWVPDASNNEAFPLWSYPHSYPNPKFVYSSASGKEHRYLFFNGMYNRYHAIYLRRNGCWQPVTALTNVGELQTMLPQLDLKQYKATDGVFWNDRNGDARVSLEECTIVPGGISLSANWGTRIGNDLNIYMGGLVCYAPVSFTEDGAPVYGPQGMKKLALKADGDLIPIPEEKSLLCMNSPITGIDVANERVLWSYPNPYPNVHGSHLATMARPGLIIGALKLLGVAEIDKTIGRVFAIRGNLGQDFLMTTDGLYVGALFQDGRLPSESLPPQEASLVGMPLEGFSEGGEPFSGWFGRQADGKIRLTTSLARQAGLIVEVKGLETIQRFTGPAISLDAALLVKAEQENMARLAAANAPKRHVIKPLATAPTIDGNAADWAQVAVLPIERAGSPNKGSLKLGYDAVNLYVLFDVQDPSPWKNEGKEYSRLFKTGDAVDLQFCTDPKASAKRTNLLPSDVRLVFSQLAGKPVVVLMKAIDPTASAEQKVRHESPVGAKTFDRIEVMADAKIVVKTQGARYFVEAAIPLKAINLTPQPGMTIRGDAGIISSDAQGMINVARTYWSNKATNLVNDLPQESWLFPATWGELSFE